MLVERHRGWYANLHFHRAEIYNLDGWAAFLCTSVAFDCFVYPLCSGNEYLDSTGSLLGVVALTGVAVLIYYYSVGDNGHCM